MAGVVSIEAVAAGMDQPWRPVDLVRANDTVVRMARFEGSFETSGGWLQGSRSLAASPPPSVSARRDIVAGANPTTSCTGRDRPVADAGPAFGVMVERPETTQRGSLGREND